MDKEVPERVAALKKVLKADLLISSASDLSQGCQGQLFLSLRVH